MIYEAIEDIPIIDDISKKDGTIRKGWKFELIREPTPKKKKYKFIQIDTKYPITLYLRRSELNKYMMEVKENE